MISRSLYINTPCHLKMRDNQLVASYSHVVGQEDLPDKTAPIEDLGFVVLEHKQITLSHVLLSKLVANNVAVICCDDKMMPTGMLLNLEGNTIQSERFRAQIEASEPLKKQLWQQTIMAKINNQKAVLDAWQIESTYLKNQIKMVKSGDSENAEAKCSYFYWQRLFPAAWNFTRKREGAPPNNLLNYGYAIIRATVARALVGAGLLPTLGIFHRNRYNAYCLADDIMEPYRQYVDLEVRRIVDKTSILEPMQQEHKINLLNLLNTDVEMDGIKSPLQVGVQKTVRSLVKCYEGEARKLLFPEIP